ncbi:MAG: hypothetical protein ACO3JL_06685 [Myxococcota bacterium]
MTRAANLTWPLFVGTLLGTSSCAPVTGPLAAEVVVRAGDAYELATVQLESVTDLFGGGTERFDVRAGGGFYAAPATEGAELDGLDVEAFWASSRAPYGELRPDLTFDGERWVARDFDGLYYLTVLYNLERSFLHLETLRDRDPFVPGSRVEVSLYGTPLATKALPIPVVLGDNAAYSPGADQFLIVPVISQRAGAPPFMDEAVATHELHHRVFFHRVMSRDDVFPLYKRLIYAQLYRNSDASADDPNATAPVVEVYSPTEARSLQLLKGFDEGLADVFAVSFTGDPDLLGRVLPEAAAMRHLEGEFARTGTFADLEDGTLSRQFAAACQVDGQGNNFARLGVNHYCVGTLLAASLWQASGPDPQRFREELVPSIGPALDDIAAGMVDLTPAGQALVFSLELALEALARHAPAPLQEALCAAFATRFGRLLDTGSVPTCAP